MKRNMFTKRIFITVMLTVILIGCLSVSVFAAKEMFLTIDRAGVTGIDEPVAGKKGDYTATAVDTGKYTVENIDYYETATNKLHPSTSTFKYDTEYYALITIKAKSSYTFVTGYSTGEPTVAVSCNDTAAMVVSVSDDNKTTIGIKEFFPKTAKDPNASTGTGSGVTVETPVSNIVSEVKITDLDKPMPGEIIDKTASTNDVRVQIGEIKWFRQGDTTPMTTYGRFVYGETYTAQFNINVWSSYEFAKDYSHALATKDKPWHAVWVYVDGQKATSVIPDYSANANMMYLTVAITYKCDTAKTIDKIEISNVATPVSGQAVQYTFVNDTIGAIRLDTNDTYYKDGMCWRISGGNSVEVNGGSFVPGENYEVTIRLKAEEGYAFGSGMTATINGKTANVTSNSGEAKITYTFPKTGNAVISEASVSISAPKAGEKPSYVLTSTDKAWNLANYNDSTTENGISWYNETDKKQMYKSTAFEGGKEYSVSVTLWTEDGYEFAYKGGAVNVSGYVNGKSAEVSSRSDVEVTLTYTFPSLKVEVHKCSPTEIDERKAICTEDGKKAYYFCSECGKYFENSACTKEISNIDTWGIIPKTEHKGGKATCKEPAKCETCGAFYGEKAEHSFGTSWDYKDALGHAHTCKVCGIPDSLQPHVVQGTPKCGEIQQCSECKTKFGEVTEHQWSKTTEYTDNKGHAHKCDICGDHDEVQAHSGGTADCMNKAKCSICGTEYGKTGDHKWSDKWDYTTTKGHAHMCTVEGCSEHSDVVKHTPGPAATETTSQICTECKYIIAPVLSHVHKLVKADAVEATCTVAGKKSYYYCESCDGIFSDSKGNETIADKDSLVVPAKGHKDSKWQNDSDVHWKECTVDGFGAVTVEKEAHDFNKKGKCKICSFKIEIAEEPTEDPEEPIEEPTEEPEEPTEDPEEPEEPTETPREPNEDDESESGGNTAVIIAIIAVTVAVVCIVVTVVIVTKNKK